jgi:hypothetical protein
MELNAGPACIALPWHIVTSDRILPGIAGFPFLLITPPGSCPFLPKLSTMLGNKEIFLFQNIRQVILAERWCIEHKVDVRVIPVPRPYSTECGMCLEISRNDGDKLESFAQGSGMTTKRI